MTAVIQIEQATAPAGPGPGFSFTTGTLAGQTVTITSVGSASTHAARIIKYPDSDAATLTQTDATTWTFTPSPGTILPGGFSYAIELVTDQGLTSEDRTVRVFGIRDVNGYLIPVFGARADPEANDPDLSTPTLLTRFVRASTLNEPTAQYPSGNPFNWAPEMKAILRALLGASGSTPRTGGLLWKWNRTDVSQFEAAAFPHDNGLGGGQNAATALGLSVVDLGGERLGSALRVTATSLDGGGMFPVLESELLLPSRYVVFVRIAGGTSSLFQATYLNCLVTDAVDQGFLSERYFGSSTGNIRTVVDTDIGNAESYKTGGILDATAIARGGIEQTFTVSGQDGSSTPSARVTTEDRTFNNTDLAVDGSLPALIAGVSPGWDEKRFNRVGIGVYEGVGNTSGTVDFADLRIYAHPDD